MILGSFPGEKSLTEQQYYAHPRNVFWKIIAEVAGFGLSLEYGDRVAQLRKKKIALWDVMQSCRREGSLDAHIVASTVVANDFCSFLGAHPHIRMIFFNGSRAETEFKKKVRPGLTGRHRSIGYMRLPSTSPAMAMMNYEEKLKAWSVIKNYL